MHKYALIGRARCVTSKLRDNMHRQEVCCHRTAVLYTPHADYDPPHWNSHVTPMWVSLNACLVCRFDRAKQCAVDHFTLHCYFSTQLQDSSPPHCLVQICGLSGTDRAADDTSYQHAFSHYASSPLPLFLLSHQIPHPHHLPHYPPPPPPPSPLPPSPSAVFYCLLQPLERPRLSGTKNHCVPTVQIYVHVLI